MPRHNTRYVPLDFWSEKFLQHAKEFQNGEITEAVFRALLYSMGYRGREIETEVNIYWPSVAAQRALTSRWAM